MRNAADQYHEIKKLRAVRQKMPYSPETVMDTLKNRENQIP
jgi:hypothetical protein